MESLKKIRLEMIECVNVEYKLPFGSFKPHLSQKQHRGRDHSVSDCGCWNEELWVEICFSVSWRRLIQSTSCPFSQFPQSELMTDSCCIYSKIVKVFIITLIKSLFKRGSSCMCCCYLTFSNSTSPGEHLLLLEDHQAPSEWAQHEAVTV